MQKKKTGTHHSQDFMFLKVTKKKKRKWFDLMTCLTVRTALCCHLMTDCGYNTALTTAENYIR